MISNDELTMDEKPQMFQESTIWMLGHGKIEGDT